MCSTFGFGAGFLDLSLNLSLDLACEAATPG